MEDIEIIDIDNAVAQGESDAKSDKPTGGRATDVKKSNQEKLQDIMSDLLDSLKKYSRGNLEPKQALDIARAITELQDSFFKEKNSVQINALSDAQLNFFKSLKQDI